MNFPDFTAQVRKLGYARGGEYEAGTDAEAFDMQRKYIELIFGFMGITDIRPVIVEPTLMGGPDVARDRLERAVETAYSLAEEF